MENTIYALFEVAPYHDQLRKLEAKLIDATTGETKCKKEFTPSEDTFNQRTIDLNFALLGQDRKLVSCGHPGGACKAVSVDDGEDAVTFSGANGPGRFAASFVDTQVDNNWLFVGG